MKLTEDDYEEILTIIAQCRVLIPKLDYNENLEKQVFNCMKNKVAPSKEIVQKIHNNYLAINLIGLNYCNTKTFKKLDEYMERNY